MGVKRRSLLATLTLGTVAGLSGCLNLEGIDGGVLTVMHLSSSEVPDVVSASDDRLSEEPLIQRALDRVKQEDPRGVMDFRLSWREYETVADALERLPYYDRTEHEMSVPSGFFVGHDDFVYRLAYRPICSETPFVSSENPRNRCWTSVPKGTTTL
ncbi:hypothetical protein SAMN04487950_2626 [Halogranum rubrum]|uniref:Uncharacterized protein n=1 Tax=Halogranum rubrum TaxID=553466 RepID=A0A1I4F4I5_9EURY|nr:hypothetical protein SAMN04487950_2626 [Halogranum rubrum]